MQELTVVGVRVELPTNQPIVLLKEATGDRYLPIWIGAVEATAIAFAQQQIVTARPMTHDLMKDIVEGLGVGLTAVHITDLQEGVFYATLVFDNGAEVSARPSDAIALAMRMDVTIYAEESVLADAGIPIADEQESEVEKFREFLDQISPEDFKQPGSTES
ncbi:MAG: bifunctional nuclease family protein [Mycobacteriales bacterium]|nr:bifunctional nuclease family protein [Frankia sp.]